MTTMLPLDVQRQLQTLSHRTERLRWLTAMAMAVGALLSLAAIAMALDWGLVWYAPVARWAASLLVLGGWLLVLKRILHSHRRRSLVATAQAAEARCPALQERYSTLASLDQADLPESMRGAPSLRAKVQAEASALRSQISAPQVVPLGPCVQRAAACLAGGSALLIFLAMLDREHTSVLAQRLAMPWAQISMTQLTLDLPHQVIPRHEPFTLTATLTGRTTTQAELQLQDETGERFLTLWPGALDPHLISHFLKNPTQDFSFRFRANDGQTAWQRLTVADRPVLRTVSYLLTSVAGPSPTRQSGLPSKLRAVAGSTLEVRFESNVELARLEIYRTPEGTAPLPPLALVKTGGAYGYTEKLQHSLRFYPLLTSEDGLTNLTPPVCLVEVIPDAKPVLAFTEECAKSALTAQDTINLAFRADDDLGITRLEAKLLLETSGQARQEIALPLTESIPTNVTSFKHSQMVNLGKFSITPATIVALAVAVTDTGGATTQEIRRIPIDAFAKDAASALTVAQLLAIKPQFEKIIAKLEQARQQLDAARANFPAAETKLSPAQQQALAQAQASLQAALAESETLRKQLDHTPLQATADALERIAASQLQPSQAALAQASQSDAPAAPAAASQQHMENALAELRQAMEQAGQQARSQAGAALAAQMQKLHELFLAGVTPLPNGTKVADLLRRLEMGTVEADEETLKALREHMEKVRELLKQFAALMDQDPNLRARFMDAQSKFARNLRDQLHLLALGQVTHTSATSLAATHANDPPERIPAVWQGFDRRAELEQQALLAALVITDHKAVTWLPKQPDASAVVRNFLEPLHAATICKASEGVKIQTDLTSAQAALPALTLLDGWAEYAYRRNVELTAHLEQQTWLNSVAEARRKQQLAEVASLHQRNLWRTGSKLAAKITDAAMRFEAMGPDIERLAVALIAAMRFEVVPPLDAAATKLHERDWPTATREQTRANQALTKAEAAYDALLKAITDEMKKQPPEQPRPGDPDLAALLALLEKELEEGDDFGLAGRQLNVQMNANWPSFCKNGCACSKPGSGSSAQQGAPMPSSGTMKPGAAEAQALAAQAEQAKDLARQALAVKRDLLAKAAAAAEAKPEASVGQSDQQRRLDWNQIPSELKRDLRQQRDVPPPEEYRQTVESYFRRLALEK